MKLLLKFKGYVLAFVLGAVLFGGIAPTLAANSGSNITVYFSQLKYFFDGVEKKTPADQKGFIYNGTTYVPLRFVSESLGKDVSWDGKTSTVYVGEKPGEITYLDTLKPHTTYIDGLYGASYETVKIKDFTSNTNEKFYHGLFVPKWQHGTYSSDITPTIKLDYLTNGQYKKLKGLLSPSNYWNDLSAESNIGGLIVYADEKEIYRTSLASDITKPIEVDLDITGVNRIQVELYGIKEYGRFGFLDARFEN